ncbi:cyclodeaminase/cyclohydrolase family protein [Pseudonocardia sp. CA-107938]|uniref:cyclodeaminase/cyclohydrolase family protein n=1 Tax=Pseudonocardia sp. CA-107938 TaxID=3240021 RepID=UPI003D904F66
MTTEPGEDVRAWSIETYLERLAAPRPPTPAGGVIAALAVAQAAALLTMVARIAGSPPDVLDRAGELQEQAVALAAADMRVFDAVTAATRLPRDTDEQRERRSAAVAEALLAAAGPPAEVVRLGGAVVDLAEQLVAVASRAVLPDVAAAAEAAGAAVAISRTNVEANLRASASPVDTEPAGVDATLARVAALRAAVRRG